MIDNISILTYTHSKCFDLHEAYFSRLDKHFPEVKSVVLSDKPIDVKQDNIIYDDSIPHFLQMTQALDEIKTDYVIYSQEDYILFSDVDTKKIKDYIDLLNTNDELMFIRLIKSGLHGQEHIFNDELVIVDNNSEYYFSTQITIWKKECLKAMFNLSKVTSVFQEPDNSKHLKSMNKIGLCTTTVGNKVGGHYNSLVYPYIATAVVKGKWNYSEYKEELDYVFYEYNINKKIRGIR